MDAPYAWVYLGAMNLRPLALVLVLAAQPVAADRGAIRSYMSGEGLAKMCSSTEPAEVTFCYGYLSASYDAAALTPLIGGRAPSCEPAGSLNQLRSAFLAWSEQNQAELHRAASALVRQALGDLWPCPKRAS
jgi:hypothetical protein